MTILSFIDVNEYVLVGVSLIPLMAWLAFIRLKHRRKTVSYERKKIGALIVFAAFLFVIFSLQWNYPLTDKDIAIIKEKSSYCISNTLAFDASRHSIDVNKITMNMVFKARSDCKKLERKRKMMSQIKKLKE